jgi:long-chain acyl-CoA synthetase
MLAPLHIGAEIVFESDLRRIRERMGEVQPTIFFGVPALYAQMYRAVLAKLETDGKLATFHKGERIVAGIRRRTGVNLGRLVFRELHQRLGGRVRFFASGGAALPPDLSRKFALLGIPIQQGWGLTEASPVVAGQALSMRKFLFSSYYDRVAGTVGTALPGVDIACIDVPDKNTYVQIHGEGELLIRGPNVMQGYYRNEGATREVMLGEWLRTGDIGRVTGEGLIYLTGRAKSVIVLDSGEKVYPDELEERFEEGGVVHDVCVIGHRTGRLLGERKVQVAAVVYPDPAVVRSRAHEVGERLTPELIERWVREEVERAQAGIAPFKRISEVILTDQPLPRTDLHKVKRGQIREHYPFEVDRLLAGDEVVA